MSKLKVPQLLQQAEQLEKAGKLAEMEQICQEIVSIRQDVPKVWHLLGTAARARNAPAEAVEHFEKSLSIFPDSPRVLGDLASTLIDLDRVTDALPLLTKARGLKADSADISLALGKALLHHRRFPEAEKELRIAIEKFPTSAEARLKLGNALRGQGKMEQAVMEYQTACRMDGNYAEAFVNLGAILYQSGRLEDAMPAYRRAVSINPNMFQARNNLGVALNDAQKFDEAAAQFQAALKINPGHARAYHGLATALRMTGATQEAIAAYKRAVELAPEVESFRNSLIYALNFPPAIDATVRYQEARLWAEHFADPHLANIAPQANSRDPQRRLKIGYVSGQFRNHPLMFQFVALLRAHHQQAVEVFCYANQTGEDSVTARIKESSAHWRPIATLNDDAAAAQIRSDGIDILVDLSLHSVDNRLQVFARKPAPIQVSWLGYVGTTGMQQIDYRLTDRFLDPPERPDDCYSETSFRLADSFTLYDPLTPPIPSVPTPALANGHITFGCQNAFPKWNEPIVSLWANVLKAVPGSRLVVQADPGPQQQRLAAWLGKSGVAPSSVSCVPQSTRLNYLQTFQQFDLALDTFPYCGNETTLDAFWMGVPVLSLCGKDALSRTGLSFAANLGLAEALVVTSPQQFVERAVQLTSDLSGLNNLRQQILPRLQRSPLMQHDSFATNLENAYRQMWLKWCQQG